MTCPLKLISLLRQGKKLRRRGGQGKDRRGGLVGMTSIHERPASAQTREIFGDWEGDLIKGAGNASAIGALVERKSRLTVLVKMKDSGANAVLDTKSLRKVDPWGGFLFGLWGWGPIKTPTPAARYFP